MSGYYPTSYSVVYNTDRSEHDIALDGLTFRLSSYPKNVYGVDPCVDSRVAQIVSRYKKIPDNPALQKCVSLMRHVISGK